MPNDHYAMVDIKLSYHGSFTPTILVKFTANWILRLLRYYYVTFFLHSFMRGPTLSYPCFGQNPGNRVNGRCPCVRSLQNKKKKKKISIRNGHLMTWNFCVCNLLPLTRLPSKFRLCLLSRPFFFFFFWDNGHSIFICLQSNFKTTRRWFLKVNEKKKKVRVKCIRNFKILLSV